MNVLVNTERETEYYTYINDHIACVQKVWQVCQLHLIERYWLSDEQWQKIEALIFEHDRSKFSSDEFYGYSQFFYPEPGTDKNKDIFMVAWNHHQKANRHHWNYWVMESGTVLGMPFVYIFEMLCDWSAMSLYHDDLPSEFFTSQGDTMKLTDSTRKGVINWLPFFDGVVRKIKSE